MTPFEFLGIGALIILVYGVAYLIGYVQGYNSK